VTPRGTRRILGLVAVLALLGAALFVGTRDAGTQDRTPAEDPALAAARVAAALPGCPQGLTTDLPAEVLPCYAGGPGVQVSAAPGRPMLVNLWATWCAPCVDEVPELVRFAAAAGDRVGVVGVVHEDSPESVYAFARQFGINYPLVRDDAGGVLRRYGGGPPRTLLVAADGSIAHVQVGAFRNLAQLEDAVATHLGVRL